MQDINITKEIKEIDFLRADILQKFSELNKSMLNINQENKNRFSLFSDIIINCYILAEKMGIDYSHLDQKIINQLKINMFKESEFLKDEYLEFLKYLSVRD